MAILPGQDLLQIRSSRRSQQVALVIGEQGTIAHHRNTRGLCCCDAGGREGKRQGDSNAFKSEPRRQIRHGHTWFARTHIKPRRNRRRDHLLG